MKTNSKEVKDAIRKTLLDSINFEHLPKTYLSLWNEFNRVAMHRYNIQKMTIGQTSQFALFREYLEGLPIALPYYNQDIVDTMQNEWGLMQPVNKDDSDSIDLFYHLLYRELNSVLKKELKLI